MKQMLADNTQGLRKTKQSPSRFCSIALGGGGESKGKTKEISMKNMGVKLLITNLIVQNSKQTQPSKPSSSPTKTRESLSKNGSLKKRC